LIERFRYEKDIPGDHWVVIPQAGHVPHEERPDAFVETVKDFVSKLQEE
jgi:pimeloyl-ACP methyl ester carboxylesterase